MNMAPEIFYLKKDTDKFNIKTIAIEKTQKLIQNTLLFSNYLILKNICPAEFITFIENYKLYPDPFTYFYHLYDYCSQYYNKEEYIKLFYREIYIKIEKVIIIFTFFKEKKKYVIMREHNNIREVSGFLTYEEAIKMFYTNNYL